MDERALKTVQELEEVDEVFGKLVLDLSAQAHSTHGVLNDATAPLVTLAKKIRDMDSGAPESPTT